MDENSNKGGVKRLIKVFITRPVAIALIAGTIYVCHQIYSGHPLGPTKPIVYNLQEGQSIDIPKCKNSMGSRLHLEDTDNDGKLETVIKNECGTYIFNHETTEVQK